jgi:FHS family L-fucose permease-like MFS transporter
MTENSPSPPPAEVKTGLFRNADGRNLVVTFALVSSLFLLWGVCNGMIDTMDKHFQTELGLSKAQSAWVQFAHYLGYFLMALPAGMLASRLGYKGGIIAGLLMVAVGGFWFLPATHINALAKAGTVSSTTAFLGYLGGVCAIAAGLTFLETVANPYTTVLGPARYAATRINLAQSCNGVGWIFGPIIGSLFFYSKDAAGHGTGNETLYIPYVVVAVVVVVLAAVFYVSYIPDIKMEDDYHLDDATPDASRSIWKHPHFVMGVAAQFFYVAAQAGIFSFFINSMTSDSKTGFSLVPPIPASWDQAMTHASASAKHLVESLPGWLGWFIQWVPGWLLGWFEPNKNAIMAISDKGASALASLGFVCFLAGRFTGAGLLKKFSAHKVLGLYGVLNVLTCLLIFLNLGWTSVICIFLSYFFMSIMFPTIFALGIFGLGNRAKKASSFIVMAIMGGAILPKLMGAVADKYDMSRGYVVPMVCFAIVAFYGFSWSKLAKSEGALNMAPVKGH